MIIDLTRNLSDDEFSVYSSEFNFFLEHYLCDDSDEHTMTLKELFNDPFLEELFVRYLSTIKLIEKNYPYRSSNVDFECLRNAYLHDLRFVAVRNICNTSEPFFDVLFKLEHERKLFEILKDKPYCTLKESEYLVGVFGWHLVNVKINLNQEKANNIFTWVEEKLHKDYRFLKGSVIYLETSTDVDFFICCSDKKDAMLLKLTNFS